MYSLSANARRRKDFLSISVRQQRMLPEYLDFLARIDQLIVENADMMDMITQDARSFLIPDDPEGDREPMDPGTSQSALFEASRFIRPEYQKQFESQNRPGEGYPSRTSTDYEAL